MNRAVTCLVATTLVGAVLTVGGTTTAVNAAVDAAPGSPTGTQPFPVRGGVGLLWLPPEPAGEEVDSYVVQRLQGADTWVDASGTLAGTTRSWVDRSLAPGQRATYRVVAGNSDGTGLGPAVGAGRPSEDPELGSTDILLVGSRPDGVAGPVTSSPAQDGMITLTAGTTTIRLPAVLSGPGDHQVRPTGLPVIVTQDGSACALDGLLKVERLAYTPGTALETMAAQFQGLCTEGPAISGEIRFKSAEAYAAISVSPASFDLGRVSGTSQPRTVTIENYGTKPVPVSAPQLSAGEAEEWTVSNNTCPATVAAAATCSFAVSYRPTRSGAAQAWFQLHAATAHSQYDVRARATGVTPPGDVELRDIRTTMTGVDFAWSTNGDGGSPITGRVMHRYVDGVETRFPVAATATSWVDLQRPAGASYAMSAVNEVGEGLRGPIVTPPAPAREVVAAVRTDETTGAGLIGQLPWGARQAVPIAPAGPSQSDVTGIAHSPDGRSLAFVRGTGSSAGLWVGRADSATAATPVQIVPAGAVGEPAWSPDGSRIAFQRTVDGTSCVELVPATGGAVTRVGCGMANPTWMVDARTLIVQPAAPATSVLLERVRASANGQRLGTIPGTANAQDPEVSPKGHEIAFILPDASGTPSKVAMIGIAGAATPWSRPVSSAIVKAISWRPDSDHLAVLSTGPDQRDVVEVAPTPLLPGELTNTVYAGPAGRLADIAFQGLGVTIKPTPAVTGPNVSIPYDRSALLPTSGLICELDRIELTSCGTSAVALAGLTSGTHRLQMHTVEPGQRHVYAARTFTVDATAPVARITSPAYSTTLAPSAAIGLAATDASGVASFDVRYRRAHYSGTFGAYTQPWTATTARTVSLGLAPGYEYCVSTRARDVLGNLGSWSAERCFARPMDDRWLTAATPGWTRASWSAFYLGTATHTGRYGATLSRTLQGRRFSLVATRCPTCGTASVYLNGRYITAVNLYSATTQRQAVIPLPTQTSIVSGTLTLTTRTTNKLVQIDGLAVRRT